MNKDRNPARIRIFRGGFGARFAPSKGEGQAGMAGDCYRVPSSVNTHLKMLKTKRLRVFEKCQKSPSFWQAANWRKWEHFGSPKAHRNGTCWRHEYCQRASNIK